MVPIYIFSKISTDKNMECFFQYIKIEEHISKTKKYMDVETCDLLNKLVSLPYVMCTVVHCGRVI